MSKAKYEKGNQICTIAQFESSNCTWFKWRDKTTHRSVLISLQYRTLKIAIEHGLVYEARLKGGAGDEPN